MATTGEGEPTDNAKKFYEWLNKSNQMSLEGVSYAVFGLGNSTYNNYNAMGKWLDQRMRSLGATPSHPLGLGDDSKSLEEDFATWKASLFPSLAKYFGMSIPDIESSEDSIPDQRFRLVIGSGSAKETSHLLLSSKSLPPFTLKHPAASTVIETRELCNNPDERSVRHLTLEVPEGIEYTPGDHVGIYPENSRFVVTAFLDHLGLSPSLPLTLTTTDGEVIWASVPASQALRQWWDLQGIPRKSLLKILSEYANDQKEKERLEALANLQSVEPYNSEVKEEQLTLLEILQLFPSVVLPPTFPSSLPRLQPRYYSVASSLSHTPQEVHITVARLSYSTRRGRDHRGVASHYLGSLPVGSTLPLFIQTAPSFHPPPSQESSQGPPLLCIGPGTGVAPFRGFLKAGCPLWLFFGCRSSTQDFLYKDELLAAANTSQLNLVTAFSRDQNEKIYVQHRLREKGKEVWKFLSEGGRVYICGDARVMAKDVEATLLDIFQLHGRLNKEEAQEYFEALENEGRYATDVWY